MSLDELWRQLRAWVVAEASLVGCAHSLRGSDGGSGGAHDDEQQAAELQMAGGILRGHAYALEAVVEVAGERLLRLRNPWGYGEWHGAWSDHAAEWTAELQRQLKYAFAEDGQFWMRLADFAAQFNTLYVARCLRGGVPSLPPPPTTTCLLYTSPSPRDRTRSRMPSSA